MIAGFPATPLALSTAPRPIPDPKEPPKTRSLACCPRKSSTGIARPGVHRPPPGAPPDRRIPHPTDEEWEQFLGHFERRKLSVGNCGRAFGTPCTHEHASDAPCSGPTRPSGPALPRSATTSPPASPKPNAKAGSARSKDSRSGSPAPTTNSPRSTAAAAAASRQPRIPRDTTAATLRKHNARFDLNVQVQRTFARRSSRFSRSRSAIRFLSPVAVPGRSPESTSALFTQLRSVSVFTPSCLPTRAIEPRSFPVSARTSNTICTARSRSSAGCGFLDTMSPNFPRGHGHGLQETRGSAPVWIGTGRAGVIRQAPRWRGAMIRLAGTARRSGMPYRMTSRPRPVTSGPSAAPGC